jgi:hypothetical protein
MVWVWWFLTANKARIKSATPLILQFGI